MDSRAILLTGATGFVGGAMHPALIAAGGRVRCLTRHRASAEARWPALDWYEGDVGDEAATGRALSGCRAALYLVHGMGEGRGFHTREVDAARAFARSAAAAGVERIVYLGGVAPTGECSQHLRSRLEVGEVLRAGPVPAVELRASMIIGHGSLSWLIVRDLAARLPVMVLPRWLASRTEPVAIDDVVIALTRALDMPFEPGACFDLPGPRALSGREILEETARVLGLPRPRMLELAVLTPRLSSLWVRLVTRANWSVARELVLGLTHDLIARDDRFWHLIGHSRRLSFAQAAKRALAHDRDEQPAGDLWRRISRRPPWRRRSRAGAGASAAPR